ncbi:MAG: hypothetical protein HOQ22_07210 [Nocardioidaceae bacterium]|nr:hypothetical protein [Nocardioidaceae bacterium]NUS50814.1 hypothetical protein [Nocardioidaceae bacterium]
MGDGWVRDRTAGWFGIGFLVLLLGSEGALTLPDADASAASVADFYDAHAGTVMVLQVVGFAACVLLGLFAYRLRVDDRRVAVTGMVLAAVAAVPAAITLVLAAVADPAHPGRAGTLNDLEPRGDDLLFLGVLLFALAVAAGPRSPGWLRGLAAAVAALTAVRLVAELFGSATGVLASLAPVAFLLLVAALVVVVFRGRTPGGRHLRAL